MLMRLGDLGRGDKEGRTKMRGGVSGRAMGSKKKSSVELQVPMYVASSTMDLVRADGSITAQEHCNDDYQISTPNSHENYKISY